MQIKSIPRFSYNTVLTAGDDDAILTGDTCALDRDACRESPCLDLQTCTDLDATTERLTGQAYTCGQCPPGYTDVEDKCQGIFLGSIVNEHDLCLHVMTNNVMHTACTVQGIILNCIIIGLPYYASEFFMYMINF